MCVEHRGEIDPCHQQIVTHVILALHAGSGTEIGADGDIRSTRHIAGLSKTEVKEGRKGSRISRRQSRGERQWSDIQIGSVIPDWA